MRVDGTNVTAGVTVEQDHLNCLSVTAGVKIEWDHCDSEWENET